LHFVSLFIEDERDGLLNEIFGGQKGVMRQIDPQSLIAPLCALAEQAGAAILAVYRRGEGTALAKKADDSPLTEADLAAHRVIVAGLGALTPDIAVVSEEGEGGRPAAAERFWLADPLDGTKEFLARNGEFTVNIALIAAGAPVFGVVHAPVLARTYWGGAGLGAFCREGDTARALHVGAPPVAGAAWRAVASKSHLNEATRAFLARLGSADLVQAGSSLKFCRVAEGAADIYPRLGPTSEWDTAAAQALVEGAGGFVYDLTGARLRYGKAEIVNPPFIAASLPFDALAARMRG